jgi:hypothetical protein
MDERAVRPTEPGRQGSQYMNRSPRRLNKNEEARSNQTQNPDSDKTYELTTSLPHLTPLIGVTMGRRIPRRCLRLE